MELASATLSFFFLSVQKFSVFVSSRTKNFHPANTTPTYTATHAENAVGHEKLASTHHMYWYEEEWCIRLPVVGSICNV